MGNRIADDLPDAPGAYVLVIEIETEITVEPAKRSPVRLAAGRYAYCGSAYGPGGLGARVRRHLRRGKSLRWHVDRLTETGRITALHLVPGGSECALLAALLALPEVSVPVPGFGSSDCRSCPAHLVALPGDFEIGDMTLEK